jgi:hypothetical protein
MQLDMQLLLADFGKRKGHLLSLFIFIPHIKWGGVFRCALVTVLVCQKPVLPLPLSFLRQPDCFLKFQLDWVAIDSEIGSENCVAVDSEVGSKNCIAVDSEIDSKNHVATD